MAVERSDEFTPNDCKKVFFFSKPNREVSDSTWYNSIPPHVEDERASDTSHNEE